MLVVFLVNATENVRDVVIEHYKLCIYKSLACWGGGRQRVILGRARELNIPRWLKCKFKHILSNIYDSPLRGFKHFL
jgi:hypothetical protein